MLGNDLADSALVGGIDMPVIEGETYFPLTDEEIAALPGEPPAWQAAGASAARLQPHRLEPVRSACGSRRHAIPRARGRHR